MHGIWPLWAVLLAAPPTVHDATECVDPTTLDAELNRSVPQPKRSRLQVEVSVDSDTLLTLVVRTDRGEILNRTLPLLRADCPSAPGLVARIVARRVRELPHAFWARPPLPHKTPTVGGSIHLGARLPDPAVVVEGGVDLGWDGPELQLRLVGTLTPEIPIDDGAATLTTAALAARFGWRIVLGPVHLVPTLGVEGGAAFANGRGFTSEQATTLPTLDATAALTLRTSTSLSVAIGAVVPIVQTRLVVQRGSAYTTAPIRAFATLGVRFD